MSLYVDGSRVGASSTNFAQAYEGYWRSAATTSAAGPSRPTSSYVNGTVDEVAIYSRALIGLGQVGAWGRPVRRSHRGAGRLHIGQAPAQQASSTCSSPSSCHRVRPTPPVVGGAAAPGSKPCATETRVT
jgi:hypothetical protein